MYKLFFSALILLGMSCSEKPNSKIIAQACHSDNGVEATCTGSRNCTACKNCKYCKHCSKNGGSCGVCR